MYIHFPAKIIATRSHRKIILKYLKFLAHEEAILFLYAKEKKPQYLL